MGRFLHEESKKGRSEESLNSSFLLAGPIVAARFASSCYRILFFQLSTLLDEASASSFLVAGKKEK